METRPLDHARRSVALRQAAGILRETGQWLELVLRDGVVNAIVACPVTPNWARLGILRLYGLKLGKCRIYSRCWFGGSAISIGDGTLINQLCRFDNSAPIEVGRDVGIGMDCWIVTSTHTFKDPDKRAGGLLGRPVRIGDGAALMARVTVLPGVEIGAGCVIAAGSVVTSDCQPHSLYSGNPASRVGRLPTGPRPAEAGLAG